MIQRQETNYDWETREQYKMKHNKQKTQQYTTSPSNVGDKYPANEYNSAGDNDVDMSNW